MSYPNSGSYPGCTYENHTPKITWVHPAADTWSIATWIHFAKGQFAAEERKPPGRNVGSSNWPTFQPRRSSGCFRIVLWSEVLGHVDHRSSIESPFLGSSYLPSRVNVYITNWKNPPFYQWLNPLHPLFRPGHSLCRLNCNSHCQARYGTATATARCEKWIAMTPPLIGHEDSMAMGSHINRHCFKL